MLEYSTRGLFKPSEGIDPPNGFWGRCNGPLAPSSSVRALSDSPLSGSLNLVADCWPEDQHAALNLPDSVKGETIVLLTTRRDVDRSALIAAAHREGLSELYISRQVLTVREIPLLGSGKPDYPGVRRLAEDLSAPKQSEF